MKTSYTKEELLGAIFKWDNPFGEYIVIENGDDVQLKNNNNDKLFPNYTIEFLNGCLDYLVKDSLNNKIPDKWCIKCTPETYNDISKWFNDKLERIVRDKERDSYWHFPEFNKGNCSMSKVENGYKEITFEFFKKFILKEFIEEDMTYLVNILKKYNIK